MKLIIISIFAFYTIAMWFSVALFAYFLNAGVYVADKFLLSKKVHSSIAYAFFVGIWSVGNAVLLFADPWIPDLHQLGVDLAAGLLFLVTLVFWYKALHQSEATRVVPIVGALVPVFSLILGAMYLDEALDEKEFISFVILIAGGALISVKETKFYRLKAFYAKIRYFFGSLFGEIPAEARPTERLIVNSTISAFFFASFYILMKYIYTTQPFIGAFVWSRFGSFLGCILILLVPSWCGSINEFKHTAKKPKNILFFLSVRLFAALAFILLNYAISLGNVALVNALQGVQFLFLIIIVFFLSSRFPHILKEEAGRGVILQKILGVALVSLGLWVLVV